jgi:hypothetical protein
VFDRLILVKLRSLRSESGIVPVIHVLAAAQHTQQRAQTHSRVFRRTAPSAAAPPLLQYVVLLLMRLLLQYVVLLLMRLLLRHVVLLLKRLLLLPQTMR